MNALVEQYVDSLPVGEQPESKRTLFARKAGLAKLGNGIIQGRFSKDISLATANQGAELSLLVSQIESISDVIDETSGESVAKVVLKAAAS